MRIFKEEVSMANCVMSTKSAYFVAGIGLGAAVALLLAPQSGKQTRKLIVNKAEKGKDFVAAKGRDIRSKSDDLVEQGKDLASKQKERLADAIQSGAQAARDTFAG
jgi:gas vesicle protein